MSAPKVNEIRIERFSVYDLTQCRLATKPAHPKPHVPSQPAKVTPFAGGNEAAVRRNRCGGPAVPSEQKGRRPRCVRTALLLAETKSMSGKIVAEDFAQSN